MMHNLRLEIDTLKDELTLTMQQVEQYKAISQANEERLMEVASTYDIYKLEMEKKLNELIELDSSYKLKITDTENKLNQCISDLEEALRKAEFGDSERSYMQQEIVLLKEKEAQALENISKIKEDMQNEFQMSQEAQEKYEREVISHGMALATVNELKAAQKDLESRAAAAERKGNSIVLS
jgi:nucleoprotein TPR